jgi:hypothetical protein
MTNLGQGSYKLSLQWNSETLVHQFENLTYLLKELSSSWEAVNCAAIQEIPSNFKEPEGSSPCSEEPSTGPYPEPVRSSPYHPILSLYVRWVPCHHGMARPQVADWGNGLQIWRVAASILNKQSRTADKGWSSSLGVGRGTNNSL